MSDDLLERLRSLLYAEPREASWRRLLQLFAHHPDKGQVHLGLAYAADHLDHWPDRLRVLSCPNPDGNLHPAWPIVRHLDVSKQAKKARAVEDLLGNLDGRHITHLTLERNDLDEQALHALVTSCSWPSLTHLELRQTKLRDGIAALDDLPWELTYLGLGRNEVKAEAMRAWLATDAFAGVTHLDLTRNRVGVAGAKVMFANPACRSLRTLVLHGCGLRDNGVGHLANSDNLDGLVDLRLVANDITTRGLDTLLESDFFGRLSRLDLERNRITELPSPPVISSQLEHLSLGAGLSPSRQGTLLRRGLGESLRVLSTRLSLRPETAPEFVSPGDLPNLEELRIEIASTCALAALTGPGQLPALKLLCADQVRVLGDGVGDDLVALGQRGVLRRLRFSYEAFEPARAAAIASSAGLATIEHLIVNKCRFGDHALDELGRNQHLHGLRSLELSGLPVSDDAVCRLIAALPGGIERLCVNWVQTSAATTHVLLASPMAETLRELELRSSVVDDQTLAQLATGLPELQRLCVTSPNVSLAGWEHVARLAPIEVATDFLWQQTLTDATSNTFNVGGLRALGKRLGVRRAGSATKGELIDRILAVVRDDLHAAVS